MGWNQLSWPEPRNGGEMLSINSDKCVKFFSNAWLCCLVHVTCISCFTHKTLENIYIQYVFWIFLIGRNSGIWTGEPIWGFLSQFWWIHQSVLLTTVQTRSTRLDHICIKNSSVEWTKSRFVWLVRCQISTLIHSSGHGACIFEQQFHSIHRYINSVGLDDSQGNIGFFL